MISFLKRPYAKFTIAALLILGLILFNYSKRNSHNALEVPPILVKVATVNPQQVSTFFSTIGTIKALQGTSVSATVAGKIASIQFSSGQSVGQGQILFTLENEDLASVVRLDESQYVYDQTQYQRYAKLGPLGAVSQSSIDLQKSSMQKSKAQLDQDTALLNKTIITAPFSGTLGVVQISIGQYVTEGQSIVALQDNSTLFVDFYIPERIRDVVKVGDSIRAQSKQSQVYHWEGTVEATDPSMDNDARNILVRAKIKPPYDNLVPGMYVDVSTPLSSNKATLVISQQAVLYNPYGDSVFVYDKGKVMQRPVVLGERVNTDIVVLSGLKAGEQIVVSGQQKLFSGMSVDIAKDK